MTQSPVDVAAILDCLNEARRGGDKEGSVGYDVPSREEAERYGAWVLASLDAPSPEPPSGFVRAAVEGRPDLIALVEDPAQKRGAGAVVLRPRAVRRVIVEAPHIFHDKHTLPIAAHVFEALGARALLINTVHRHRSEGADVAHADVSMFLGAHEALTRADPKSVAIQLHGFSHSRNPSLKGVDAIMSAARTSFDLTLVAGRLAPAIHPLVVKRYPEEVDQLGGTTNVEAKASAALGASFVHIEMSDPLRDALAEGGNVLRSFGAALRMVASKILYDLPDHETLGAYLAMLRRVLVDARSRAYERDPQMAELLDAVENVPDLVARFGDMDQAIVLGQLQAYEQKHLGGEPVYSRILSDGAPPDWQLEW